MPGDNANLHAETDELRSVSATAHDPQQAPVPADESAEVREPGHDAIPRISAGTAHESGSHLVACRRSEARLYTIANVDERIFKLIEARSLVEAIELAGHRPPGTILMDESRNVVAEHDGRGWWVARP